MTALALYPFAAVQCPAPARRCPAPLRCLVLALCLVAGATVLAAQAVFDEGTRQDVYSRTIHYGGSGSVRHNSEREYSKAEARKSGGGGDTRRSGDAGTRSSGDAGSRSSSDASERSSADATARSGSIRSQYIR